MPQNRFSSFLAASIVCAAAVLAGCQPPPPAKHVALVISATGDYQFNGAAVSAQELSARIAAAKPADRDLMVDIHASPQVGKDPLEAAVAAIKAANARVSYVK